MKLLNSTIGLKALMAVTGIILIGFVIIHMLGNLQIFLPNTADGAIPIDEYGKLLKSNAGVLWGARLTLLASIGAHIYSAVALTQRSRAARPQNYEGANGWVQPMPCVPCVGVVSSLSCLWFTTYFILRSVLKMRLSVHMNTAK